MKIMKYPLLILAIVGIVSVLFLNDLKNILNIFKSKVVSTLNMNQNNPFNLRYNKANTWKGKVTKIGAPFESFESLEYGIRAGIMTLKTYFNKYKLNTVNGIITRFAPESENDTENYISYVCSVVKVAPNAKLNPDKETLWLLSKAICKMENSLELKRKDYEKAWSII